MNVPVRPAPSIGRLKWHSRRALLELDLVLDRFWQRLGEESLDAEQARILEELLELEDHDLWDMMCGRQETPDPRWENTIEVLMKA